MPDRTLVVVYADDEPIARRGLARLLAAEPDVRTIGGFENGLAALEAIRAHAPDVALLDVAMPGMTGVEVVRALPAAARPAVVFVTAFDQFAIDAFDLHAVDYLIKPFDDARFRVAFQRVRERVRTKRGPDTQAIEAVIDALSRRAAEPERLAVKDGDAVVLIALSDIVWCEAEDNYVRIHAVGRRHLVRMTMRSLMDRLGDASFARIHRSVIVNMRYVRELRPAENGDYRVLLNDGTKLTMSRTHRDAVLGRALRIPEGTT